MTLLQIVSSFSTARQQIRLDFRERSPKTKLKQSLMPSISSNLNPQRNIQLPVHYMEVLREPLTRLEAGLSGLGRFTIPRLPKT
jgi:hypothetical protein